MGRSWPSWLVGFAAVALLVAAPVEAQNRAARSRPSDSVSERLGHVGGTFTRTTGGPSSSRAAIEQATVGARRRNFSGSVPNGSPLGISRSDVGFRTISRFPRPSMFVGLTRLDETPLPGINFNPYGGQQTGFSIASVERLETTVLPAANYAGDTFREFFNLKAVRKAPEPSDEVPAQSISVTERIEMEVGAKTEELVRDGIAAFKAATAAIEDEYAQRTRLSKAASKLDMARTVRPKEAQLEVLSAHICLEKSQLSSAVFHLLRAGERDVHVFENIDSLDRYFGDYDETTKRSEMLSRQMYRFVNTADLNENSAIAHVVTAYCAWVIDDQYHLNHSMSEAIVLSAGSSQEEKITRCIMALRLATKKQETPAGDATNVFRPQLDLDGESQSQ